MPHALADYRALAAGVAVGQGRDGAAKKAADTDEAADVDYFLKNAPDALDRALEGIGRVGSIVRSMTEFAHPDARTKADVDLNRAIKTTLNMARNEYKAVAELVTEFGDMPTVHCHAGDINQVVLNLLLNAAHAIGDVVDRHQQQGPHHRAHARHRRLRRDIDQRHRRWHSRRRSRGRIFEPFVTTKEVGRGTGQGLALSRGIVVEKLKGSLHFETETGKGRRFSSDCRCRMTAIRGPIHQQAGCSMTSLHVLFVDDEQAILDGLRNSLRKERKRWDMTFALGGQQALEQMKQTPADVVITDMRMPGMDGAELLRHIQRDFPAAARIVLSGQAERESIMRALPVTHQFLHKPCDGDTLRAVIEQTHALHKLMQNPALTALVGKLERIPGGAVHLHRALAPRGRSEIRQRRRSPRSSRWTPRSAPRCCSW